MSEFNTDNRRFIDVRIFFSKTGIAKYISHLDLYRAFGRTLKRSGLPLWVTEGFNPHIYTTFALPLALGVEGLEESLDVRLIEDVPFAQVAEKLNAVMPQGLAIIRVAAPVRKANDIERARYMITANDDNAELSRLDAYLSQDVINIVKKSKTKTQTLDVKPLLDWDCKSSALTLPAGNTLSINPWNVLGDFTVNAARTAILCSGNAKFE
ncbi:MAG: TIGR03936 family radical SAM-associated protein [Oscillospiraceae bacterium]|nr:TIGR03936 family radical SAM-associated protein [Oscillospiraceae bacterium]